MQQWSDYLDGLEGRGENITIRLKKWGKLVEFLKRNKGIWGLVIQAPFFIAASQEISFDTPTSCDFKKAKLLTNSGSNLPFPR